MFVWFVGEFEVLFGYFLGGFDGFGVVVGEKYLV